MNSLKPDARKRLADSLKKTLETFEIQISDIAKKTRTDRENWYKRVNNHTDIKLLDILVICEYSEIGVIPFLTEMAKKYYSEN